MKQALLIALIPMIALQLIAQKVDSELSFFSSMEDNRQWPSYRGYYASGYMDNAALPDSFNVKSSYNVKWNIEIPGLGLSCPVIWDERVFITTAVRTRKVTCLASMEI